MTRTTRLRHRRHLGPTLGGELPLACLLVGGTSQRFVMFVGGGLKDRSQLWMDTRWWTTAVVE